MKHKGADIRILDISKDELLNLIEDFISTNNMETNRDDIVNGCTKIIAINHVGSYFWIWWNNIPQVFKWSLTKLEDNKTRIELHIDLTTKFRRIYWLCLAPTMPLLLLSFYISETCSYVCSPIWSYIYFVSALGFCVFLWRMFQTKRFKELKELFWSSIDNYLDDSGNVTLIEERDTVFPEVFNVLIYSIVGLFLYGCINLFMKSGSFGAALICILVSFIGFLRLYGQYKYPEFGLRLNFSVICTATIIPVGFLYLCPGVYYAFVAPWVAVLQEIGGTIFQLFALVYLSCSVLLFFIINPMKIARGVNRYRSKYYKNLNNMSVFYKASQLTRYKRHFSFVIFFQWIILSIFIINGVFYTFSVIEFAIIKNNIIFDNDIGKSFYNGLLMCADDLFSASISDTIKIAFIYFAIFIYSIPLFWMFFMLISKRVRGYLNGIKDLNRSLTNDEDSLKLNIIVSEIALQLSMRSPQIVIFDSKNLNIESCFLGFPFFKSYIRLTKGIIKTLDKTKIEGLIAHEMYHIKHHTLKWYLLNLLSDYTLFGAGYLAATTDSFSNELQADDFAIKWLKKKNGHTSEFIDGLQMIALSAENIGRSSLGLWFNDGEKGEAESTRIKEESFYKKLKINIDGLSELYFGDKILTYIHPPLGERIERIKAIEEM